MDSKERETICKMLEEYMAQGLIEPCDGPYVPQPLNDLVGPLEEDHSVDTSLCATHIPGGSGKAPAKTSTRASTTRSGRTFNPRIFSEKSTTIRRPPGASPKQTLGKASKSSSPGSKTATVSPTATIAATPEATPIDPSTGPALPAAPAEGYNSDYPSSRDSSSDSEEPVTAGLPLEMSGARPFSFEPHSTDPRPSKRSRSQSSSGSSSVQTHDLAEILGHVSQIVKNANPNQTSSGWKKAKLDKFTGGNFPAFLEDYRSTLAGAADKILIDQFPLYISQPEHLKNTLRRDAVEANLKNSTWDDFRTLALSRFVGSTDPYNSYLQHLRQWPPVTKPDSHSLRSLLDNLKQYRSIVDGFADRHEDKVGDTQLIDIFLGKIPSDVARNFNVWMAMTNPGSRPQIKDLYAAINIYEKSNASSQAPSGSALHYPLVGQYQAFKSSDTQSVGFVQRREPFEEEEVDDVTKRKIKRRFYRKREPSSSDDESSEPEERRPKKGKARHKSKPSKKATEEPSHSMFRLGQPELHRFQVSVSNGMIRRVSCRFCRKTMEPGEDLKEHLDKCPLKDRKKCFADGCDKIFPWDTPAGKRAYFEHLADCPKQQCGKCRKKGHSKARCPQVICEVCGKRGHLDYVCEHLKKQ